jgi:hypothetical protein
MGLRAGKKKVFYICFYFLYTVSSIAEVQNLSVLPTNILKYF